MSLTPLVNLPSPSDPANFAAEADNFLTVQLPNLVNEWNTDIALFNNQDTRSTSTTSLLIGLGTKSLTVGTGKMYQPNMSIRIAHTSTANAFMEGLVTSYNSTTGALVVNVLFVGSATGTLNSWNTFLVQLGLSGDNNSITSLAGLSGSPRLYLAADGTVTVASATNDAGVPTNFFGRRSTNTGFCIGAYAGAAVTSGGAMFSRVDVTSAELHRFYYTTTQLGSITTNGSVITYGGTSDYRLKENIQPLTNSGAFIDAIKPSKWTWKTNGVDGVGFIAHELQEVSPSSVHGDKDAIGEDGNPLYQSVGYSSSEIIANMVLELQSLRKRVAELENQ